MTGDGSKEGSKGEDCSCHEDGMETKKGGNGSKGKEAQQEEVEKTSSGREDVGAAEVAVGKRGCEDTEGEGCRKYRKAEVDVEEEEGLWEVDSRYGEYLYET